MQPAQNDPSDDRTAALAAVDQAAGTADLLAALDRSIDFIPDAGDGVVAELRDGDGAVIARLTGPQVVRLVDGLAQA